MTYHNKHVLSTSESRDSCSKIFSWALLNFKLQVILHQEGSNISEDLHKKLEEVGYTGGSIQELSEQGFKDLFKKESFFSSSQTGKRIVSFALQENGLHHDSFTALENSITDAFKCIKDTHQKDSLLEESYQHCIDTLCVFRP